MTEIAGRPPDPIGPVEYQRERTSGLREGDNFGEFSPAVRIEDFSSRYAGLPLEAQHDIIIASQGVVEEELASHSKQNIRLVRRRWAATTNALGVPTMAVAVRLAIHIGAIDVTRPAQPTDERTRLDIGQYRLLDLLSRGYTNAQVKRLMGISDSTTKEIKRKIYERLGASNMAHAVRRAYELGIFEL